MSFNANAHIILDELAHVLDEVNPAQVDDVIDLINASDRIFFQALGRASFAGRSFVMRLMHMGREVYVVGETNTPNFGPGDVLIICSGSGSTKQFIDTAEKAHALGGKVLAITGTPGSTLDKMADATLVLKAPSKNQSESAFSSQQPMASLFEQAILIAGDAIVLTMMERMGEANDEMFSRHSNLE